MEYARSALHQENGRAPTIAEIAQRCQLPESKVRQLLLLTPDVCSMDAVVGDSEDGSLRLLLEDIHAPQPQEELVRRELAQTMERLLSTLTDRQRRVLRLRFGMEDGNCYSLEEIRLMLGISKERVRQIEKQALEKLRKLGPNARTAQNERVLVTTLTKKMAEDLTAYLRKADIRVRYMHADIGAMERMEIIRDLRMAKFDVLVGINLLREGLDLPEVSLVAILDADKEGFLRSETSLIQTIGRAARNADGLVIMYADHITPSMQVAMDETERRRRIQDDYNKAHGIVPKTVIKSVRDLIEISSSTAERKGRNGVKMTKAEKEKEIARLEKQMKEAARMMEYEYAAVLRDQIIELRGQK